MSTINKYEREIENLNTINNNNTIEHNLPSKENVYASNGSTQNVDFKNKNNYVSTKTLNGQVFEHIQVVQPDEGKSKERLVLTRGS